jgi:hypothetical protein
MATPKSPSDSSSGGSNSRLPTSIPSSPPSEQQDDLDGADDALVKEEEDARAENEKVEEKRRQALLKKKKKKKAETKSEREAKARELDDLLAKSAAFSDILTKKTQVLGRVGSSLDGKTLGEHNLAMAQQPKCMINGTMRDYQLEGLTWMYEICSQGMSGILADEMGLGKFESLITSNIQWLTFSRQDCADHCFDRASTRAGELPWSSFDRRTSQYFIQLDGRVRKVDAFYPSGHVPWQQGRP